MIAREPTLGRPAGVHGLCVIVARFVFGLEVDGAHDSVVSSGLVEIELFIPASFNPIWRIRTGVLLLIVGSDSFRLYYVLFVETLLFVMTRER